MNTSQQARARAGLRSCQAWAPKIGRPDFTRSRATPESASVKRWVSVAPRDQPNSKANVAEAAIQPSTAPPISSRKRPHHIGSKFPVGIRMVARTKSGRFEIPSRTVRRSKVLMPLYDRGIRIDTPYANMSYDFHTCHTGQEGW